MPLRTDVFLRLIVFAIGFAPITSLSLSTFELIPLHISGPLIVLPALLAAIAIALRFPRIGRKMAKGFALGVVAVSLYDSTRLPFVLAGVWGDFIPKIGNYLLNEDGVHWSVGYLWRYLGNGGGMGMAFYLLSPLASRSWCRMRLGLVYGVGIFLCLIMTIYLSPAGTKYLFEPNAISITLGLVGHIVFGTVLGIGASKFPDSSLYWEQRVTETPSETINAHFAPARPISRVGIGSFGPELQIG